MTNAVPTYAAFVIVNKDFDMILVSYYGSCFGSKKSYLLTDLFNPNIDPLAMLKNTWIKYMHGKSIPKLYNIGYFDSPSYIPGTITRIYIYYQDLEIEPIMTAGYFSGFILIDLLMRREFLQLFTKTERETLNDFIATGSKKRIS